MKLESLLKLALLGSAFVAMPVFAIDDDVEIDVPAKIDIQGKKVLWMNSEDKNGDNLENWFGRATLGVSAKGKTFEGKITLRAFPADFGTTTQIAKTYAKDTTVLREVSAGSGNWSLKDTSVTRSRADSVMSDKFELYEAWTEYKAKVLNVKMGRFLSNDRAGMAFGNYADEAPKTQFMPAGVGVNALEINKNIFENVSFRMAFESRGQYLNKGDLRIGLKAFNLSSVEMLKVGINYRNNMFDVINNPDTMVTHNASAVFEMPIQKWRIWTEFGFRGMNKEGNTPDMPISGGVEIPLGRALDKFLVEAEWFKDRKAVDGEVKEVVASMFLQKKLGDRMTISFGIQASDGTKDYAMVGRLTGTIN